MFLVCFVRKDQQPNEEYYYVSRQDAQSHFDLFRNDNSHLYCRIDLIEINSVETLLESIKEELK